MTIKHIYNIINKTMKTIEDIDMMSLTKKKYNQNKINEAYELLDNLRDELIRENIKRRHERE